MKIKNRIALQFSLIVASILLVFSVTIYLTSANFRQEEFFERLKKKARTTVRFLIKVKEVDKSLLKIIDRNTLTALYDEKVLVFNNQNQLIYASVDDQVIHYQPSLLDEVRQEKEVETFSGDNELVGLLYDEDGEQLVVLASANDRFGKNKMLNLRYTLGWGLLAGIGVTVVLGIFFAGQSLQPINRINQEIQTITAKNLRQRLNEGPRQDEIGQLAMNFNLVLERLEQAFDQQRSFVSHASHELRTPLAALKSEIQLGMRRKPSPDEYTEIMKNLLEDTDRLIGLSNSLLFLARTLENLDQLTLKAVRMEDVLFLAQEELISARPQYRVAIDYVNIPEAETETLVQGNEELLKRVALNLMDNACKYSPDHRVEVQIRTDNSHCWVDFRDQGIGIDSEGIQHIFEPFYRSGNAKIYEGFGIGLSISQRIVELHQGIILVESQTGRGSVFTVKLPHL
ncbi:HAMP domain-containing sensor histidine kinase [Tellurirhabdus bombi]|uniref:HAMP domain-containing sensor histidine kinase n=1 Tax=Tellurirhabdus bombi TaxID=2907205 RepID=UPI001F395188|nr:HAMP domain-containing sensor histidine kinase [Tellurirhabdus bombi]